MLEETTDSKTRSRENSWRPSETQARDAYEGGTDEGDERGASAGSTARLDVAGKRERTQQ